MGVRPSTALRAVPLLSAVLAVVIGGAALVGCAVVPGNPSGPGRTGVITTTGVVTTTGGTTTGVSITDSDPVPGHPVDGTVVLSLRDVQATVAGVVQVSTIEITGSGRVTETLLNRDGSRVATSSVERGAAVVDQLLAQAARSGLLQQVDPGEPHVTDSPWLELAVTTDRGSVRHRVDAPGYDGNGLSDRQRETRSDITALAGSVRALAPTGPVVSTTG